MAAAVVLDVFSFCFTAWFTSGNIRPRQGQHGEEDCSVEGWKEVWKGVEMDEGGKDG